MREFHLKANANAQKIICSEKQNTWNDYCSKLLIVLNSLAYGAWQKNLKEATKLQKFQP